MRSVDAIKSPTLARLALIGHVMAFASALLSAGCVHTAPFTDSKGHIIPHSIASMEKINIGGLPQSVWFRGLSQSNQALILLHGGPGATEAPLFRHYNSALEEHYLVIYWEQRGTGRSFSSDIPPASMTIERFVLDLDELVELVKRRFGQDKVVLLGHSWGTVVGTLYTARYPEKVAAYVGVAQMANIPYGRRLAYDFALSEAHNRQDAKAVTELEEIGPPPYASVDDLLAVETWTQRFGGVNHSDLSTGKLIWTALCTDEANLIDLIKFGQGNRFSLTHLEGEISRLDLSESYRSFAAPIVFFLGRYDRHVPSVGAEQYFDAIQAPCKRLVWFEQSGHNPPFEEPDRFNGVMIKDVLSLAIEGCSK
jgi:pimeloyl-ACP methyl ester carboxylesterase